MSTNLTPSQYAAVQAAYGLAQKQTTNANIAAVWQSLSSFGDAYAAAAVQAVGSTPSAYGYLVSNQWIASRANLYSATFTDVAFQHITNYLGYITQSPTYELPTTTQSETGYSNSIAKYNVPQCAEIDLMSTKIRPRGQSVSIF
jgi:hypothetical protein